MKKAGTIILIAASLFGCATGQKQPTEVTGPPAPPPVKAPAKAPDAQTYRMSAFRRLDRAVALLGQGNVAGATKALKAICAGKAVSGVTDEALFRLALLTLKPAADRPPSKLGLHYLKRLRDEYPASSWTVQAAPLMDLLDADDELRQQNRTLRATNQNLSKRITELNENIQQLKHLDLELEQKNR